jgi:hypothetical protein
VLVGCSERVSTVSSSPIHGKIPGIPLKSRRLRTLNASIVKGLAVQFLQGGREYVDANSEFSLKEQRSPALAHCTETRAKRDWR